LSNSSSYSRLNTPGPGRYRTITEFGYMESFDEKNLFKTSKGFCKKGGINHSINKSLLHL